MYEPYDSSLTDQLYYDHVLYDAQTGEKISVYFKDSLMWIEI